MLTSSIVYANASKLQQRGTKAHYIRKAEPAFELGLSIVEEKFG